VGALIWQSKVYRSTLGWTEYEIYPHDHSVPPIGLTTCTTNQTDNLPPYFKVAFIMSTVATDDLPLGAISMWGDSIANIPPGWNQCTGESGTPNLLNSFPLGVAAGEQPGLIGGKEDHQHIYTEVPQHTHTIQNDDMEHRHIITTSGSLQDTMGGSIGCRYAGLMLLDTDSSNPSHSHDILPTGDATCYTSDENSIPPYVKLIYMQKGQAFLSPTPENGATDINYNPLLSVFVNDLQGDNLNVTFYDASDDSLIDWDYVFGGTGTASVTWSGLSSDTVYSWYIITDDGVNVSRSPTWSFTTNYAPGLPTNPTPSDGATDINFNPTLSVDVFDNDGDFLNVSFYDASDDSPIGIHQYVDGGSGTASVTWSGLTNDTIYSWYAKSDDLLNVSRSTTWSFTTNYAPGVPINPTPSDGATSINYSPTLTVDVFDNDGDDLTVSFYDASNDSLIGSDNVLGGIGNASVTWTGISSDTSYSWYARSDDGLNIRQSANWSFTTNYAPDAPTNPTPNDGAIDIGSATSPWTTLSVDVFDVDGDTVTVTFYNASDDSPIGTHQYVEWGSGTASVTWPGLSSDTSYSWYARSGDGLSGIQSATWSFTTAIWVENRLPQVTNPTPNDGATGIGDDPTLSVDISDADGDTVTVTFYNASDDSLIGEDIVTGGSGTASVTWSGVTSDMVCQWYVYADDGKGATQSAKWTFSTTVSGDGGIPIEQIILISLISGGAVIGVSVTLLIIRRKRKK